MKSVQTKEEVLDLINQHRNDIKNYGVLRVGLFGSFMKGTPSSKSDVDLLVEFDPEKKNFRNFINLAFFLEDLFHRKVELVTMESLSPYLKPHILKEVEYALS